MKIAIMQPYFFPYLGYLALIKHSDLFIFFDTPQFIRHGWIERNRILKPEEGWQYIKVPLEKHSRGISIKEIMILSTDDWKEKIIAQLAHYKKRAPFYNETLNIIMQTLDFSTTSITRLNVFALEKVFNYLNLNFEYKIFSEMDLKIKTPEEPDEWALNITKELKANIYINPPGGENFFNKKKFENENIKLYFLKIKLSEYNQRRKTFEPGLSIIDVLMFNSPEKICNMLDDFILE